LNESTLRSAADPGFAVYVHWPFCAQKCPYCDFNSHVRHGGWDENAYLAAYLTELRAAVSTLSRREPVTSIFFGGGTPSLMHPETVHGIIDAIAAACELTPDCEITLEANPGSVEAGRFRGYRTAGVNRVSLGVQALDDTELRRLGRIHTVSEALAALDIALETFDRVSFDLIYARPGMTETAWESELSRALGLQAGHLSLYQLTIEDGTPFAALHRAGKLAVPDPELADRLYEITQQMCEAAGLPAYEISNHAAPGQESQHNLLYWRYGEYAGVGPGAHSRLAEGDNRRALVAAAIIATFLAVPAPLIRLFLDLSNPAAEAIVAYGSALLAVAALFQLADAAQVMALGLLRGVQDTRVPMVLASVSYWLIGIPASYALAFPLGLGGVGLWLGLVVGLAFAAVLLMVRFWRGPWLDGAAAA
jgi:oxygen-independent coproporphyrinogen-3 oxidase